VQKRNSEAQQVAPVPVRGRNKLRPYQVLLSRFKSAVLILIIGIGIPTYAATWFADDGVNKRTSIVWPVTPSALWWLASTDGLDYDTLGATGYRNYGSTVLTAPLADVNRPGLTEGILQPDQGAVSFNGTTNYLQINSTGDLDPANESYTVFAVVRATTATGARAIFEKRLNTVSYRGVGIAASGGVPAFFATETVTTSEVIATAITNIGDSKWHTVAGVYKYSAAGNDTAEIYIDGNLEATAVGAIGATTNAAKVIVGAFSTGSTNFWQGDIAMVAVWDGTALTATQITSIQSSLIPAGTTGDPFPTIQSAAYARAATDTIYVKPGRYQETVSLSLAGAVLATNQTFGNIPELYGALLPAAAGNDGLTVTADNEIGFVTIRGYGSQGLLASSTSDGSLFHHLEVDSCLNAVDFDGASSNDSLINCTIDGASIATSTGFRATTSSAVTVVVKNCIFVNTVTALTKAAAQTLTETHNDFYNNTTNYASALAASDLTVPPHFYSDDDFRLLPGSPLFKRGEVIHSGASPFTYYQQGPEPGVWEGMKPQPSDGEETRKYGRVAPWARK